MKASYFLATSAVAIMSCAVCALAGDAPSMASPNGSQIVEITISPQEYLGLMNYLNQQPRGVVEPVAAFLEDKQLKAQMTAKAAASPAPKVVEPPPH